MSSWSAEIRRREAALRRDEREEKKAQRELERRRKMQAKLSTLEQARLEVDSYENELKVLLSVHKSQSSHMDWRSLASALSAHSPLKLSRHELAVLLRSIEGGASSLAPGESAALETARALDEQEYEAALETHEMDSAAWDAEHRLARGVVAGEARAYVEAVSTRSELGEMLNLGSSLHLMVHDATLVECDLNVNGQEIIPPNAKSLTAAGKVAVKVMPKPQFHELYQDYVCSCVLRVARELFALLPVDTVLIKATVDGIDTRTGHPAKLPVLSLAAPRSIIEALHFDEIDPSDSLANFQHRGDVMASRKSGAFTPIKPLTPADLVSRPSERTDLRSLMTHVEAARSELASLRMETENGRKGPALL